MIDLLILTGPAGCSSAILPGLDEYGYTTLSTDDLGKSLWVRTTEPGFGSASMADCLRQYESIQGTVQMASEDAQFLNETRSQYPHAHARGVLEAITKTSDDAGIYPSLCNGSRDIGLGNASWRLRCQSNDRGTGLHQSRKAIVP
jgi:hypothetical protein